MAVSTCWTMQTLIPNSISRKHILLILLSLSLFLLSQIHHTFSILSRWIRSEVIQYDEFLSLTSEQLVSLVRSDHLTVTSEEKVYESVISWIQFDVHERRKYLPQLLEHVRLPLVSQDYLMSRVENEPLMKDLNAKDFIIEALKFHLLKGDAKNTLTKTNRTIPRQPIGQPKVLLVIGGQAPKAIRSVECYDLREEQWYAAAEMPSRRCRYILFHHFSKPIYFLFNSLSFFI